MSLTNSTIALERKEIPKKINLIGFGLLGVGLILVILSFFVDKTRSLFDLLIFFTFILSIGLGSLFLVALEYIGGAVWSTPFRRISEFLGTALFLLPIIAIPLLFNMHDLYHWTHEEAVSTDRLLQEKSPYLNMSFFLIRTVVFVGLWFLFYILIIRNSRKQDSTKDPKLTRRNIVISAIFLPIFAITITFASIDWIMTLEPHWFSTIFGVYYFAGTALAALAATTFIMVLLNENGYLYKGLNKDHYYSFGALLFGFVNFWAYIAFSQYLLIWYADLPEETFWFFLRWEGSWKYVSIGLIFVKFVIPYFGLLSQPSKMNPRKLLFFSAWIMLAHLYDLYWLIMPTYNHSGAVFSWHEIAYLITAIGLLIVVFSLNANKFNIIPIGDPKLKRGLNFHL